MCEEVSQLIFKGKVNSSIYNEELCYEILDEIKRSKINIDKSRYYSLTISFNLLSYTDKEKLTKFVIEDKKAWYSENDSKEKISLMLSQQLSKITENLEILGLDFRFSAIEGEELSNANEVNIYIFNGDKKEYDKKGNLKKDLKCNSIIPSFPGFLENLGKAFAYIEESQKKRKAEKEIDNYVPNIINVSILMESIAKGMLLGSKVNKSKKISEIEMKKQNLLDTMKINIKSPLELSGNFDVKNNNQTYEIDCPNILVYKELANGNWLIKGVDNLKTAESEITKYGYNKTDVNNIVVLKDLKPLPFILISKNYDGMTVIKRKDVKNQRDLSVCWE